MKQTSSKARNEVNINSVVKTKVASSTFTANTQFKGTQRPASKSATPPTSRCIVCKGNHHIWECRSFKEKSPTQQANVVAEAKLCFSCLRETHMFRQCPNPPIPGYAGMTEATAPIIQFFLELREFIHQNLLQPTTIVIIMLVQGKVNLLVSNHWLRPILCHLWVMSKASFRWLNYSWGAHPVKIPRL